MIQRCERACFAAEARQPFRISRELIGEGLDGDVAAEFAIVGAINLAHAARPQQGQDAIRPKFPAHQGAAGGQPDCGVIRIEHLDLLPQLAIFTGLIAMVVDQGSRGLLDCQTVQEPSRLLMRS